MVNFERYLMKNELFLFDGRKKQMIVLVRKSIRKLLMPSPQKSCLLWNFRQKAKGSLKKLREIYFKDWENTMIFFYFFLTIFQKIGVEKWPGFAECSNLWLLLLYKWITLLIVSL